MKKILVLVLAFAGVASLEARVALFGDPAEYGIQELGTNTVFDLNPYAWEVFTEMDAAKMFGTNQERITILRTEFYSTFVHEGMKTGQNSFVFSILDRGALFGGEGYAELAAAIPAESRYARQYFFFGGWKYNLNDYLDIDIGGNFRYASERVAGPGLPGGGVYFSGDLYVGIILKVPANPFFYYMYNPDYDAQKIMAGINPTFSMEPVFGFKNLYFEMKAYYGYVAANRWTGNNRINGSFVSNSYGFVQTEGTFVYTYEKWRFSIGGGYSYHNSGSDEAGIGNGPPQNTWVSTSVGFVF